MTTDSITKTTKKGGRPRIAAEARRSERLAATVTQETHDAFCELAGKVGMTTSDYLHSLIVAFLDSKKGGQV